MNKILRKIRKTFYLNQIRPGPRFGRLRLLLHYFQSLFCLLNQNANYLLTHYSPLLSSNWLSKPVSMESNYSLPPVPHAILLSAFLLRNGHNNVIGLNSQSNISTKSGFRPLTYNYQEFALKYFRIVSLIYLTSSSVNS